MSVIRPPTQVHDGFATIRTRGLCRTKSRAEQIDRCRTTPLQTNFKTTDDQNHNNNDLNFLQSQDKNETEEPYYSSPKSLPCSTFRPALNNVTPPTILPNNIKTNPLSLSPEYQNVVKKSQFSLESLSSSTATPRTPNEEYQDPKDDDIFLYSAPESPQYCNIGQGLTSFDELELQNLTSNQKPIVRKPPIRSTLPYKRTSFSTDCKSNDGSGSNADINSISSGGSSAYNNPLYNNSYGEPKKTRDIYNNGNITNNYYRSSCTALVTTNRNRSSSAEILDIDDSQCHNQSRLIDRQKMLGMIGRQNAINPINDRNADDITNSGGSFVRRYHTLGHPRSTTGSVDQNPRSMTMMMMTSNNSIRHLSNRNNNNNGGGIKSWHNDQREFNITDYVDPLDFKVGCQTTLRSKPIIPWYELAIRKDLKRKSCPAITNQAHVVAAFEESLTNMTTRLQQLKANTDEHKDDELTDMCQTVELLRKQSIQAGLTTAHIHNTNLQHIPNITDKNHLLNGDNNALGNRHQQDMLNVNQTTKNCKLNGGAKNMSINTRPAASGYNHISSVDIPPLHRRSIDSICSINSISSGNSVQEKVKKNNSWLRSSLRRAFSRNEKNTNTKQRHSSGSTISNIDQNTIMTTTTFISRRRPGLNDIVKNSSFPPPPLPAKINSRKSISIDNDRQNDAIVQDLKKQLREKDLVLTDIRLEALNSASQLESLKEIVIKMQGEILTLRQSNEKLQKLVDNRSLEENETSLINGIISNGTSETNRPPIPLPIDFQNDDNDENSTTFQDQTYTALPPEFSIKDTLSAIKARLSPTYIIDSNNDMFEGNMDGKKLAIAVYLGHPEEYSKYIEKIYSYERSVNGEKIKVEVHEDGKIMNDSKKDLNEHYELIIGYTYISGKISWDSLDFIVRKTFKDYLTRIDPGINLGLNPDMIRSYNLGEAKRCPEIDFPELLPCGYIIGNVKTLYICLQGVGSLAFDNLIPRSIVNRYVSLLTEHRRLILCGPSGTGKSHLSKKLAEFVVGQSDSTSKDIITIDVGRKSLEDLRQYIGNIAQKSSRWNEGACEQPAVIILDDLHKATALGDLFSYILNAGPASKLPFIIGTMLQSSCTATANVQLHHNFRWVITANHIEPVKGFLGRFLRRRAYTLELLSQNHQPELLSVLAWLSNVWQHINQFLENHSSSDVTIGPGLFLSCPLNLKDSQIWFTDLWNYNLAPYIINSICTDVKFYGKRDTIWNDPSTFIRDTYPWLYGPDSVPPLRQINAKDVGLEDCDIENDNKPDPLLNMLICLQEAANYPGNKEQELDFTSASSTSSTENSTDS